MARTGEPARRVRVCTTLVHCLTGRAYSCTTLVHWPRWQTGRLADWQTGRLARQASRLADWRATYAPKWCTLPSLAKWVLTYNRYTQIADPPTWSGGPSQITSLCNFSIKIISHYEKCGNCQSCAREVPHFFWHNSLINQ